MAFSLGEYYLAKQELDSAVAYFQSALTAAPGFFAVAVGLVEALDLPGKHAEAEQAPELLLDGKRSPLLLELLALLKE